ncbi:MAG: hypothetical protein AAFX87_16550 [Bacteroidota bacterium]
MMQIAFLTCLDQPELRVRKHIFPLLKKAGVEVQEIPWQHAIPQNLKHLDAILLNQAWDYHLPENIERFYQLLNELDEAQAKVLNPLSIIRANLNKRYLVDLQKTGVPVIPTTAISDADEFSESLITDWAKVILKPSVSANAFSIVGPLERYEVKDNMLQMLKRIPEGADLLIQRFIPEIKQGELALLFFNGKFSHAALKRPGEGSIILEDGLDLYASVSPALVSIAENALHQFLSINGFSPNEALYARVDGIETSEGFVIMEVELLEPDLYLWHNEGDCEAFVSALLEQLS